MTVEFLRTPFKQLDDAMAAGWYVEVVCPRWGMAFCPDCQDRHDDDRLRQDIDATVSALLDSCEDAFERGIISDNRWFSLRFEAADLREELEAGQ